METVEKEILTLVDEIGYDEITRLFGTLKGGKRLRAKLILEIAAEDKEAPKLGAIVELIHAASLLHDDVIDDATLRRGVASVNATEDSKTAIMLGDALYSKAYSSLVSFDEAVARTVSAAVTALSVGELMDVRMSEAFNADAERYMQMLYLKTAALIEASAKAAAQLTGKDAEAYALYGKNLGISFQIIDDILDIVSDEATLGKPALHDYEEGKCTLPYIYLYDALEGAERERLVASHKQKLSPEESAWIKAKMQEHKCIERSYALAQELSNKAIEAVSGDERLVGIIESMMKRSF
ncbi:polyprenyl synthetase family protein [Sulfurimonas sp. HSL3-7]|uniref:polyprenyl synthetase family protein n=1 Tax=Sulfonitrofixus jiaomeiensis TaxID=3131938 RepID=UPI0031F7B33E